MPPRALRRSARAVGGADRLRVIPDAMVIAAGLTSRRAPASFSRRLIDAALDEALDVVLTTTLLDEAREVLVSATFSGRLPALMAEVLLDALAAAAVTILDDRLAEIPRRCADPDDDYLVEAALRTDALLVTRDDRAGFEDVVGLRVGRPGTALRAAGLLDEPGSEA